MKNDYLYTTGEELRAAFWDLLDEQGVIVPDKYTFDGMIIGWFFDWTDSLCKEGEISEELCDDTSLYYY